jgi:hypothetical protein
MLVGRNLRIVMSLSMRRRNGLFASSAMGMGFVILPAGLIDEQRSQMC